MNIPPNPPPDDLQVHFTEKSTSKPTFRLAGANGEITAPMASLKAQKKTIRASKLAGTMVGAIAGSFVAKCIIGISLSAAGPIGWSILGAIAAIAIIYAIAQIIKNRENIELKEVLKGFMKGAAIGFVTGVIASCVAGINALMGEVIQHHSEAKYIAKAAIFTVLTSAFAFIKLHTFMKRDIEATQRSELLVWELPHVYHEYKDDGKFSEFVMNRLRHYFFKQGTEPTDNSAWQGYTSGQKIEALVIAYRYGTKSEKDKILNSATLKQLLPEGQNLKKIMDTLSTQYGNATNLKNRLVNIKDRLRFRDNIEKLIPPDEKAAYSEQTEIMLMLARIQLYIRRPFKKNERIKLEPLIKDFIKIRSDVNIEEGEKERQLDPLRQSITAALEDPASKDKLAQGKPIDMSELRTPDEDLYQLASGVAPLVAPLVQGQFGAA